MPLLGSRSAPSPMWTSLDVFRTALPLMFTTPVAPLLPTTSQFDRLSDSAGEVVDAAIDVRLVVLADEDLARRVRR